LIYKDLRILRIDLFFRKCNPAGERRTRQLNDIFDKTRAKKYKTFQVKSVWCWLMLNKKYKFDFASNSEASLDVKFKTNTVLNNIRVHFIKKS